METIRTYRETLATAVGIDEKGYFDGVYVLWSIKELHAKRNSWDTLRTIPTGKFQVNVTVPGESRQRIFRTNKHGKFDYASIKAAFEQAVGIKRLALERADARRGNELAAEAMRAKYKSNKRYLSGYASPGSSYVAPSEVAGKLQVQINFGVVDPEVAEKILAFAQSLEG